MFCVFLSYNGKTDDMPTINAHFKLKDSKAKEPTLILLKAYFNSQRFVYSTKEYINPELWDSEKERPVTDKKKIDKAAKVNPLIRQKLNETAIQLKRFEIELDRAYSYLVKQGITITPSEIKKQLDLEFRKQPEKPKAQIRFHDVFHEFLESKRYEYTKRTLQKYETLHTTLIDFEKDSGYPLSFETIDLKFYDKFFAYLLGKKKPGAQKGLLNDTIGKYFASLKVFMQWALDRQKHSNTTFTHKDFKTIKSKQPDIVTLKEDEFIKIYALDLSNKPRLERVRDVFCFAVFVGQRWSDIERLRKEDISDNWWIFEAYKTKKETKVPFSGWSSPALRILEKYDFKLPIISQQKFNDYIKEVGKLAELNRQVVVKRKSGTRDIIIEKPLYEFMSSHMARRTCVTILLERGVPPTTVQALTKHSDFNTLMRYVNTKEDALMKAFNETSIID